MAHRGPTEGAVVGDLSTAFFSYFWGNWASPSSGVWYWLGTEGYWNGKYDASAGAVHNLQLFFSVFTEGGPSRGGHQVSLTARRPSSHQWSRDTLRVTKRTTVVETGVIHSLRGCTHTLKPVNEIQYNLKPQT